MPGLASDFQGEVDALSALVASVASVSFDSGYDEDDPDGIAVLVDEPEIEKTNEPSEDITAKLQPEDVMDSVSVANMMKKEKHESRSSFIEKIAKLLHRMKKLGAMSCLRPQHKLDDFGVKEVFVRDAHAKTSDGESVSFGMHLRSVREDGILRHFVEHRETGSLADSFTLRDRDELLMVNDQPVVDVSPIVALSFFRELPMDETVAFVTRRALETVDDHILYEYYILRGTMHIVEEDDTVQLVERTRAETTVGIHDLLDVRFDGRELRSFRCHNDVFVRIADGGQIRLDAHNNEPFHFDVLRYKALQVDNDSFKPMPVLIWIVRHFEDSSCYFISKDDHTEVNTTRDRTSTMSETDWSAFSDSSVKWMTRVPPNASEMHVFQSLSAPGMFLSSSGGRLSCVRKTNWEDATTDSQTHFSVTPFL